MKYDKIIIPTIKVHPSKIITYNHTFYTGATPTRKQACTTGTSLIIVEKNGKSVFQEVSNKFLYSSRSSEGELSKTAKKKLTLAIEYFLTINKPNNSKSGFTGRHFNNKIAFITLTLPSQQVHSDNEIKEKCLNQFLIEIARYHKVTNYVWRAEYQKNGNIHFHIVVNRYIWWNDVRNRWNRIINKLGYVDTYRKNLKEYHAHGFQVRTDLLKKWPVKAQIKAYKAGLKTDFHNPNSIDIHKINNITNIKNYITKYMSKTSEHSEEHLKNIKEHSEEHLKNIEEHSEEHLKNIEEHSEEHLKKILKQPRKSGRIWGASIVLSNIKGATSEIDSVIEEHLKNFEEHFPEKIYRTEYFTIIDIDITTLERIGCHPLLQIFHRYLFSHFGISSQSFL